MDFLFLAQPDASSTKYNFWSYEIDIIYIVTGMIINFFGNGEIE